MTLPHETSPHASSNVTMDDLLKLVAGTLNPADFSRVAAAVKTDVALQAELESLEHLRSRMEAAMDLAPSDADVQAMTSRVLARTTAGATMHTSASPPTKRTAWTRGLHTLFSFLPAPTRWAYALVVVQAAGLAWLTTSTPAPTGLTPGDTRSITARSKQLDEVPSQAVMVVSFDAATPEADIRDLLLEIEAQIIAGPSPLGRYQISVALNRRELALTRLKQTLFVSQLTEVQARPGQPSEHGADKK